MKVILDTNFMLVPNQFGVDIFEFLKDYEVATLSSCVDELKKLSRSKGKDGKAARIALQLIEKNNVEIIGTREKGDEAILNYAAGDNCIVATNDIKLIRALKMKNVGVVRLRQKKYIVQE